VGFLTLSNGGGYDLIVAGCGPAGAWALRHLPAGMRVLAVDGGDPLDAKHKPKLCGGLLTAQAQDRLPELPPEVRADPFHAVLENHDLDNRLRMRFPVKYANCWRGKLDSWLLRTALDACVSDVEYRPQACIVSLQVDTNGVSARFDDGRDAKARWLLDCTGSRQLARASLGVPLAPFFHSFQAICSVNEPYPHFATVFRAAWTPFFGWRIPKSAQECEIGAAFPPETRGSAQERLAPLFAHFAAMGIDARPIEYRGCRLTRPTAMRDIWLGQGQVLACGEAAGLVSPSSGDGISFALASGKAAALALTGAPSSVQQAYRRALAPELAELRRNIVKSRQTANPAMRRLGYFALALKYGRACERFSL
jgi:geranylgeranyl reductase